MTKKLKNTFAVALLYAGAIIGAGFASGQEIIYFFVKFGTNGMIGFLLACLLFCLLGGVVLCDVYTHKSSKTFYGENKKPWRTKDLFNIFLLFSYAIMLAGMATILTEISGINYTISVIVVSLIISFSLAFHIEGVVAIGNFIVPFLIVGLTLICSRIIALGPKTVATVAVYDNNWFFHAMLYVGYNSIVAIMFLPSLSHLVRNKKDAIISGVLGGAFISVPGILMIMALLYHGIDPIKAELPLLSLTDKFGPGYTTVYLAILATAMYTTAIAALYSIIIWANETFKVSYRFQLLILPPLAIPLATTGFSKLVKTIYPLFGYIGTAYLVYILVKHFVAVGQKRR